MATSGNGRVPERATTVTPTVASVGWSRDTPSGSSSGTRNERFALRPLTSIAAVSMRSTATSLSGAPWIWTAIGSVVTCEIQYPAATAPCSDQSTGTVRVLVVDRTGTYTCTLGGSDCTPSTGFPLASTATASALAEMSIGVSPNRSVA